MDHSALLEVSDLTVAYNGLAVLDRVSFKVERGTQVAVLGPNGAGKSTLFKAILNLVRIQGGAVRVHGQPVCAHKGCISYIPQREEVDWRFPVTVSDVVMMGRYGRLGRMERPGRVDREAVNRALEQVGLVDIAKRRIGELSGGQQQRVFLARALAQEPHILFMDEPFTGVDFTTQENVLAVLEGLRRHGVTVLVSTHDLRLAAARFDAMLLLNRACIAYGPPSEVFTDEHLGKAFGNQVFILRDGRMLLDECTKCRE